MIMQAPLLDDRTFEDLVSEGLAMLPVHAPEWTDHNASDPGVTLIELLAYFSDILLYRIGRVTPAAKLQFLRLLKGSPDYDVSAQAQACPDDAAQPAPIDELARELDEAVRELAHMECAVTARDFERHAMAVVERVLPGRRAHARCLANTDLVRDRMQISATTARGHVSVVVALPDDLHGGDAARVLGEIDRELQARRLLTTHVHVVAPVVVRADIGFSLALLPGTSPVRVLAEIRAALSRRYGCVEPSPDEPGHPFGQPLDVAGLAALIDRIPGVDYVEDVAVLRLGGERHERSVDLGVQIGASSTVGVDACIGGESEPGDERLVRDGAGALSSVLLRPWEILRIDIAPGAARAIDGAGQTHPIEGEGAGDASTDTASDAAREDDDHD